MVTFAQIQTVMTYRILLVDDEKDILEFLRYNLLREGFEVFTAANGEEAIREAQLRRPHLILLDMMMPVMDGEQTCRAIRRHPELKDMLVVFLTALGGDEHQIAGFDLGADDYIAQPVKSKVLISRLRALLKRLPLTADDSDTIEIDRERHTVRVGGAERVLPKKEFALLSLLSSEPGRLFTREDIYARVWGPEVVVGERTIDVHIRKLRQKIGERRIITVKGLGYKYINI